MLSPPTNECQLYNPGLELFSIVALISVALVVRVYLLDEHPIGYPQHTTWHFDRVHRAYFSLFQEIREGRTLAALKEIGQHILFFQQGLVFLLESLFYILITPSFQSSRILPITLGLLSILIGYLAIRRTFGIPAALVFSILVAASPWHIAFSRYSDIEHISSYLHIALCGYLVSRDLTRLNAVFLGIVFGLGMYIYAANQIAALAVFPVVLILFAAASKLRNVLLAAAIFFIVTIPSLLASWTQGKWLPLRTPYNNHQNYELHWVSDLWARAHNIYAQFFVRATDPWFSSPFGTLTDLEKVVVPIALAMTMLWVWRYLKISTNWQVDRQHRMILFFLWTLIVGTLPALLLEEVAIRRMILTLFAITALASLALTRALQLAAPKRLHWLILLLVLLYPMHGGSKYFHGVDAFEYRFNLFHKETAAAMLPMLSSGAPTLVCLSTDNEIDQNNIILFLNFVLFDSWTQREAARFGDDGRILIAKKGECTYMNGRQRIILLPRGESESEMSPQHWPIAATLEAFSWQKRWVAYEGHLMKGFYLYE